MVGEYDGGLGRQQQAGQEKRGQAHQPLNAVGPPEQAGSGQHVEHEQDREHVPPVLPSPQRHLREVEKRESGQEQEGKPLLPWGRLLSLPAGQASA